MTQEEHIQQTVQKSIDSFWKSQKEQQLSIFEFLLHSISIYSKRMVVITTWVFVIFMDTSKPRIL